VDETVALRGGLLAYQIGVGSKPLQVDGQSFWVVAQPEAGASTAKMVAGVRLLREQTEPAFEHIILAMEEIAALAQNALQNNELIEVGRLMDMNHGALVALGVSTPRLDDMCWRARDFGALGAKLTGAGGGGCIITLAEDAEHAKRLVQFFDQHGIWSRTVSIGES
jgi:mevalonate kinase